MAEKNVKPFIPNPKSPFNENWNKWIKTPAHPEYKLLESQFVRQFAFSFSEPGCKVRRHEVVEGEGLVGCFGCKG